MTDTAAPKKTAARKPAAPKAPKAAAAWWNARAPMERSDSSASAADPVAQAQQTGPEPDAVE